MPNKILLRIARMIRTAKLTKKTRITIVVEAECHDDRLMAYEVSEAIRERISMGDFTDGIGHGKLMSIYRGNMPVLISDWRQWSNRRHIAGIPIPRKLISWALGYGVRGTIIISQIDGDHCVCYADYHDDNLPDLEKICSSPGIRVEYKKMSDPYTVFSHTWVA